MPHIEAPQYDGSCTCSESALENYLESRGIEFTLENYRALTDAQFAEIDAMAKSYHIEIGH